MLSKTYFACWFILMAVVILPAQPTTWPLWPEGIPCANNLESEIKHDPEIGRRISKVHQPEMVAFLPSKATATGASVLICPGGGYTILAWDWEGVEIAKWFNSIGVAAFVLKYRLPHWESEECRSQVALMDAQRAVRLIRSKAKDLGIDPAKVGVMGFSAGGHLASTLSTHFDTGDKNAINKVEQFSCRPDFSILMYPVITMDSSFAHMGSRNNLIGENPTDDQIEYFSNELQVTNETPPTILFHASDDKGVVPENSLAYYSALIKNEVSASLHIFESGGHGFGLATKFETAARWPEICKEWMEERGLMEIAMTEQAQSVKVAMAQIFCLDGDRSGNLVRMEQAIIEAKDKKADIVCFPETALYGWVNPTAHERAAPIPGKDSDQLCALAKKYEIYLCVGLAEKAGKNLHDAVILIDSDGKILLKHRKINILTELMNPPYTPGSDVATVETPFGRIGLLICADSFDSSVVNRMKAQQPDLVLIPYGWAKEEEDWPEHGEELLKTVQKAARNLVCPVIGTDLVGEISHGPWRGLVYGGQSVAVDNKGNLLARGKDRDREVVVVTINRK